MKKITIRIFAVLFVLCLLPQSVWAQQLLIPGGQLIGLELQDDTVTVAAFEAGAEDMGLEVGDTILSVNGTPVHNAGQVRQALAKTDGTARLLVLRDGKTKKLTLTPRITDQGPRLGVYLKQGVSGVGTVTWYDPQDRTFGALGHGVSTPSGALLEMVRGSVYPASVRTVRKGLAGQPGQLLGQLSGNVPEGVLTKNTVQGVFGKLDRPIPGQELPVGDSAQIRTGPATIRSTVTQGQVQEYSVEILRIYPNAPAAGRNMLLRITDPALLSLTGGIVQGMSGSPIIQDGKLIGAVTHVLVNDPKTGYGIFIENMLDAAA